MMMRYTGERRERVLFIGGPWDGRRELIDAALPTHQIMEMPEAARLSSYGPINGECYDTALHRHTYYIREFVGEGDDRVTLAMHTTCVNEPLLQLLLAGYNRA